MSWFGNIVFLFSTCNPANDISMIKSSSQIIAYMMLLIIPVETDPRPAQTSRIDALGAALKLCL